MVQEDKRVKLPSNWEAKKARADWILGNEAERKKAAEKGEDYNRLKMLEIGANEAERIERKNSKKNPDLGFAGFEQVLIKYFSILTLTVSNILT